MNGSLENQSSSCALSASPLTGIQTEADKLLQERLLLSKGERRRRRQIECRLYQLRHSEHLKKKARDYYYSHKEQWVIRASRRTNEQIRNSNEYTKRWISEHPERRKATARNYYYRHKEAIIAKTTTPEAKSKIAAYLRNRRATDPDYRLRGTLRSRIKAALKGEKRTQGTEDSIGCTIPELKQHIESLFQPGMVWGERRRSWHADHVVPLTAFNLSDPEELRTACNWRNLQPLWGSHNRKKHAMIPAPLPSWLPAHIASRIESRR